MHWACISIHCFRQAPVTDKVLCSTVDFPQPVSGPIPYEVYPPQRSRGVDLPSASDRDYPTLSRENYSQLDHYCKVLNLDGVVLFKCSSLVQFHTGLRRWPKLSVFSAQLLHELPSFRLCNSYEPRVPSSYDHELPSRDELHHEDEFLRSSSETWTTIHTFRGTSSTNTCTGTGTYLHMTEECTCVWSELVILVLETVKQVCSTHSPDKKLMFQSWDCYLVSAK